MDPRTVTFEDTREIIEALCRRLARKYKRWLSYDEIYSCACLAFLRAYETHDLHIRPFTQWLGYLVCRDVLTELRTVFRKRKLIRLFSSMPTEECEHSLAKNYPRFEPPKMSMDAERIVDLALNPPIDIIADARLNNRRFRTAITNYLLLDGWSIKRVRRTYQEIRRKLT